MIACNGCETIMRDRQFTAYGSFLINSKPLEFVENIVLCQFCFNNIKRLGELKPRPDNNIQIMEIDMTGRN